MFHAERIGVLPFMKLIKVGLFNTRYRNKHRNRTTNHTVVPFVSIINIVIVLLHLFVPCSAVMYKFPVKHRRSSVNLGRNDLVVEPGPLHVFRREAFSSANLTSMTSNLVGLSGNGYYIDVDIGTPPQKVCCCWGLWLRQSWMQFHNSHTPGFEVHLTLGVHDFRSYDHSGNFKLTPSTTKNKFTLKKNLPQP